jgi:coenzyme F420 hydrogenase subunit beta
MCGECYFQCPRSFFRCPGIVDGVCTSREGPMGQVADAAVLRSTSTVLRSAAQAGGAVSGLLAYALDHHEIDGALVAQDGPNPWEGIPTVITEASQITQSAGTKYAVCPVLSNLRKAATGHGLQRMCVVGLPCQMEALRKLDDYPLGLRMPPDAIRLRIGLFCSSNFRYNAMHKMVEEVGGVRPGDIDRIDIGEGAFNIRSITGETASIPLSVVHGYEQESCRVCPDFTAEYADISVGAIGAPEGWSVVLSRTEYGRQVLERAMGKGYLEGHATEAPNQGLIALLAEKKREKAKSALAWRSSYGLLNPFVK